MAVTLHGSKELIDHAASELIGSLRSGDYEVDNEAELCHMFWASLIKSCESVGVRTNSLKAQIRLANGGSVDMGLLASQSDHRYEVMIEAKVWLRPTDASAWSKRNQSTSKRRQCISDARRLVKLIGSRATQYAGLLILERGSTHLRRNLLSELKEMKLTPTEHWVDVLRPSIGRRKEHVGLLWMN